MSPLSTRRKFIDCRLYPSDKNCSLKISGTEEEVLAAATQHAASAHGHKRPGASGAITGIAAI